MAAAIAAAVQAALAGVVPGTVALATAAPAKKAEPELMDRPMCSEGQFFAEGWIGDTGNFKGKLFVRVTSGKQKGGITFSSQKMVDDFGSPVVARLIARCEKASGHKLGG
jgi:hypothetical protein